MEAIRVMHVRTDGWACAFTSRWDEFERVCRDGFSHSPMAHGVGLRQRTPSVRAKT
jgi:hypothetical protein